MYQLPKHAARVAMMAVFVSVVTAVSAQERPSLGQAAQTPIERHSVQLPPGYVIGLDDVLGIQFWGQPAMNGDVKVRPDGRISLPLLNDVDAAGLTPEQLRTRLLESAKQFLETPNVSVIVREMNSRKAFITGLVARPGAYPLSAPTTVLQLIALAGGITDFADGEHITITRTEQDGTNRTLKFNYDDVRKGKRTAQNIELKAGDVVVVP